MSLNPSDIKSVQGIVLKNTLKLHYSENALIELIVSKIKEIPDYEKLKSDIELILVICRMIETISADSDLKLDKLKAIIEIYKKSFDMSTDDHLNLVNVVNFFNQNRFIITKGVSGKKRVKFWVGLLQKLSVLGLTLSIKLGKLKLICCICI